MKLTKEEIQRIDDFLVEQDIKYLDVRSELIDHLATEFEEKSSYVLIEDYLVTKVGFMKDFAKKLQKTIHWSYQKQLWVQFAKFFYKPKCMLFLVALVMVGFILFQNIDLKEFNFVCFFVLVALVLYPLFYNIKYSKAVKRVQSFQSMFAVTALPSLFLYMFNVVVETLSKNYVLGLIYFGTSILLGISAALIIERDRKKILRRYYQLKNN